MSNIHRVNEAASIAIASTNAYGRILDFAHLLASELDDKEAECEGLRKDAEFHLAAQSRESEEARFYRYLRDEAGQLPDDHDGPMICSGLGDNFDFLRGEECDIALREAIDAARKP